MKQQIPFGNDNKVSVNFVVIPEGNLLSSFALTSLRRELRWCVWRRPGLRLPAQAFEPELMLLSSMRLGVSILPIRARQPVWRSSVSTCVAPRPTGFSSHA